MASALNQVWMPWQSNRDAEGWQVALKTLEYPKIPRIPRISRSENSQVLGSPRGWSRFRMKNSARAILALLAASVPAFSYRWVGCVHMAFLTTAHGKSCKLSSFPWPGCVLSFDILDYTIIPKQIQRYHWSVPLKNLKTWQSWQFFALLNLMHFVSGNLTLPTLMSATRRVSLKP